jgi:hypothetical protein
MDEAEWGEPSLLTDLNRAAGIAGRQVFGSVQGRGPQNQTQIDLNDAAQIGDLEDPGLVGHMDAARARLAEQTAAAAALPAAAAALAADVEGRRALSALMTALRDQRAALAATRDAVFLQASNAEKLAAGIQPHGFPAARPGVRETVRDPAALVFLSARLNTAGAELEQLGGALERAEAELTRARRDMEAASVARAARCAHFEEAWAALGDLVRK